MTFGQRDLDVLCGIAREAGRAILALYGTDCSTSTKHDASPLTQADTDADDIIRERLTTTFPGVPIVSEECASAVASAELFFLVDPLDGTKEFLNRTDEFTVNIAVVN